MTRVIPALALLVLFVGCNQHVPSPGPDPVFAPGTTTPGDSLPAPADAGGPSIPADDLAGRPEGNTSASGGGDASSAPPVPGASASDLFNQAQAKMQGGDLIGAIALVEQAAAAEPANRTAQAQAANALNQLGLQLVNSGDRDGGYATFIKAGTVARVLQKNFSDLNEAERGAIANCLYNEACAHGVGNRPEQALASLKDAVAAGFADASLIGSDADLAVIRDLPEFKDLLEGVGKAQAEAARREALELLASGESFPFDFSLADVDGQTVQLAALKGKVVIVDVWGTWCPPCRAEVPHFVELRNKYAPEEFAIVGINYERAPQDQWVDKIKAGIAELGINYPCVIGDDATRNQIPNFEGFPTTLFIDRTGKVRLKAVGYHDLAHLEALVTALLAEPKPKGGTSGGN